MDKHDLPRAIAWCKPWLGIILRQFERLIFELFRPFGFLSRYPETTCGCNRPDDLPGPTMTTQIKELIGSGHTIAAIKRLREATGCDLVEAKMWVERNLEGLGIGEDKIKNPCPYCGKSLRSAKAKQCFNCGKDWHHGNDHL